MKLPWLQQKNKKNNISKATDDEIVKHFMKATKGDDLMGNEGINETREAIETNVYNTRFTILLIYSLNTLMNGALFTGLSSMNNLMSEFYRVDSVWIDWLSNMFLLVFVFLSIPFAYFIDRYGVKKNMILASALNLTCTIFRYAGYRRNRYYFVLIGQVFASVAYVPILQIPGYLSFIWFPEESRATATSIGFFMNILGVAVGFIQPNVMIISRYFSVFERELRLFYFSQFGICLCVFVSTAIYFQEKPPLPPTDAPPDIFDVDFQKSLKLLSKDKDFVLLIQSYSLYFSNYVSIIVLLNSLVTSSYPFGREQEIGYMGLVCNLFGIAGCYMCGIVIDRFSVYTLLAIILNVGSLVIFVIFAISVTHIGNFSLTFASLSVLGFFCVPYFSMGIEQAAEITYPVKSSTSAAIMLMVASAYGTASIFILGILAQYNLVEHVLLILTVFTPSLHVLLAVSRLN